MIRNNGGPDAGHVIIVQWQGENNPARVLQTEDGLIHFAGMDSGTWKTACAFFGVGELITGEDVTITCPACIQRIIEVDSKAEL